MGLLRTPTGNPSLHPPRQNLWISFRRQPVRMKQQQRTLTAMMTTAAVATAIHTHAAMGRPPTPPLLVFAVDVLGDDVAVGVAVGADECSGGGLAASLDDLLVLDGPLDPLCLWLAASSSAMRLAGRTTCNSTHLLHSFIIAE